MECGLNHIRSIVAIFCVFLFFLNVLTYLFVFQLRNKEKIPIIAIACSVLTLAGWAGSLTFFLQALTSWQVSTLSLLLLY